MWSCKTAKKLLLNKIVYGAFDIIEDRNKEEPIKVFKKAMENVKPSVEVKSRRVGGASYQVPIEVPTNRRVALGLRWLRDCARGKASVLCRKNWLASYSMLPKAEASPVKSVKILIEWPKLQGICSLPLVIVV